MEKISIADVLEEADHALMDKTATIATSLKPTIFRVIAGMYFRPPLIYLGIKYIHTKMKEAEAKDLLYKECIAKQNAIIKELQRENKNNEERIEYLTRINKMLNDAIKKLKSERT